MAKDINISEKEKPQILRVANSPLLTSPAPHKAGTLEKARQRVLEKLAYRAEDREQSITRHIQRVGNLSALLAQKVGLAERDIEILRRAAPLHDVGTFGIPNKILLKPGKLSPEEFEVVKTHTEIGADMLSNDRSELVRTAQQIALNHHERFDGTGYPNKLHGNDIPLASQIVAIVDVLDTLTHERPYKSAWPIASAVQEIRRQSGRQINPKLVTILNRVLTEQGVLLPMKRRASNKVQLSGSLAAFNFFELVRLLIQRQKPLKLFVFSAYSRAIILFYKGHLVHVEFEGFTGEQAFLQLVIEIETRSDAKFLVETWNVRKLSEALVNIEKSADQLIYKAAVALHQLGLLKSKHGQKEKSLFSS